MSAPTRRLRSETDAQRAARVGTCPPLLLEAGYSARPGADPDVDGIAEHTALRFVSVWLDAPGAL
ncbi:MAG: hypothetical protein ACSLFR_13465 [Solirubrobacteraceae bacterium]